MRRTYLTAVAASVLAITASAGVRADDGPPRPTITADGVTHVPAFDLPPSVFMSKESTGILKMRAMMHGVVPSPTDDIATARAGNERQMVPIVGMMRARYPVDIVEQTIAGVPTRIFTPKDKPYDRKRVLINLHGGAFSVCADGCAMLEFIPIASVGGFKVVSVNYRMAPEYAHPAGVEDVAAVYRELLKSYKPKNIGIYGCSAGGALTGQAAAWLPAHGLPQPGAIGIFGAGAVLSARATWSISWLCGRRLPAASAAWRHSTPVDGPRYFANVDMADPIVSPALHPEVIAISANLADHRHARTGHEPGDLHQFAVAKGRSAFDAHRRRGTGPLLHLPAAISGIARRLSGNRQFLPRKSEIVLRLQFYFALKSFTARRVNRSLQFFAL